MNFSVNALEAVKAIKSGNRVFVHGSAATPVLLLDALKTRASDLRDIELLSISSFCKGFFDDPQISKIFFVNSLFVSEHVRKIVNSENGDYIPVFLSEIPRLFDQNI